MATASLELGNRYRHRRSGLPDRLAAIDRRGVAAHRPSGHWRGAIPKGRLFATTRDDLWNARALVRAIKHGDLDRIQIPEAPLDILAQQIVAMCSGEDWDEDALFDCVMRRAYPYRDLRREEFDQHPRNAVGGNRSPARTLWRLSLSRPGEPAVARAARSASGGDHQRRRHSGHRALHRGGAAGGNRRSARSTRTSRWRAMRGDIMLLGNTSWRIRRVESKPGACWSKTRTARRRRFRSGAAKLLRAPTSFRSTWPNCASASARCCRTRRRCRCRTIPNSPLATSSRKSACAESIPVPRCRAQSHG